MQMRDPLLPQARGAFIAVASFFAAFVWYDAAMNAEYTLAWAIALSVIGFVVFGFLQGFLPMANWLVYPLLALLGVWFTSLGYWLGGISLVGFALTQFRPVRPG